MANTPQKENDGQKHSHVITIVVIICWYSANIILLLLNKFLLSSTKFRQPVFLTLCHMVACVFMGLAISASGHMPLKPIKSKLQFAKVVVLSVIFCATIVLGNASLRYLPVSFTQAIGATTPFFTAVLAYFFQGTRESFLTYMTLFPIMGGIAIASGGEPLFHMVGFIFAVVATSGRALKSVVQGMIMSDPTEKLDPMSLLLYMSSVSVAILVPMTMYFEPTALAATMQLTDSKPGFIWWLLSNSILAYFVNLTNFLVTKFTSPLTLQVLGNAKGVIAAVISIMVFLNPVTISGVLGYALTTVGVFLYSEAKRRFKPASHSSGAQPSSVPPVTGDATVIISTSGHLTPGRMKDSTPGRPKEGMDLRGPTHYFRSQERSDTGGIMV